MSYPNQIDYFLFVGEIKSINKLNKKILILKVI